MKILSISLNNINSISGEYTIRLDTAPLNNAGLFLISGNTGAGKSTILDAITLALFNQIPRNGKDKNPIYVLTQGKDKSHAKVRFCIDNKIYLAEWSCSKRIKKLRKEKIEIEEFEIERSISEEISQGQYLTLASGKKTQVADKITEILKGLTFEQFCRSILLAQGEFAKLLKEDSKTRSEILQRITNMEIYDDISQAAHKKVSAAKQELEAINKQLQLKGVELLSIEEEENLRSEIIQLETSINENQKILNAYAQELNKLEKAEQLQFHIEQSNKALDIALAEAEHITEITEALGKHDIVEPYIIAFDRKDRLSEEIQSQSTEKQVLENKIANFNTEVGQLNIAVKESQLAYEKAKQFIDEQEIIWTQASKYDQELALSRQQLNKLKEEANDNMLKLESTQKELTDFHSKLDLYRNHLQEKEIILQQLIKNTPEDLLEIKGYKVEADRLQKQLNEFEFKLQKTQESFDENKNKQNAYLRKSGELSSKKKALQEEYAEFIKTYQLPFDDYQLHNLEKLERRLSKSEEFLQDINHIIQLQERNNKLFSLAEAIQEDISAAKEKFFALDKDYQLAIEQENQINIAIETVDKDLEKLKKMHHKQQFLIDALAYRQNHLHIGDNCPVCTQLCTQIPDDLEDELNQNIRELWQAAEEKEGILAIEKDKLNLLKNELKKMEQNKHSTLQQQEILMNRKEDLFTEFKVNQDNAFKLISNWQINVDTSSNIDIPTLLQEAEKFKLEKENIKIALDKARQWQQDYQFTCASLSNEENNIQQLKIFNNTLMEELNKYNTEFKHMQRQKNNTNKTIEEFLIKYEQNPQDIELSMQELEALIQRRNSLKDKNKLVELEIDKVKFLSENKSLQKQEFQNKEIDLSKEITLLEANILKKENARKELLPIGLQPEIMRQQARKDLNEKEAICKEKADSYFDLKQSFQQWQGQIQSLSTSISNKQTALQNIIDELNAVAYNFQLNNLQDLQCWILPNAQQLRDQIRSQQILIETLKKDLAQMQIDLENLGAFDESRFLFLKGSSASIHKDMNAAHEKIGNIKSQIQRFEKDKETHKQLMDLKQEKEALYLRWYELDKLIGSSNGKKFRDFAQSITLKNLIAYANIHLKKFLDGRYRLQQQEAFSMELNILDIYRANSVRSLNSLSGGETFLVSLALALALADLAGSNIKFESLFIDEGFGSLDNETLNVALRVLNKLQEEGKTIGIISHVEMLQQTIPIQIKVIPTGSGLSKIILP